MINAEIECKKSLSPVSRKWYLNREWTHIQIVRVANPLIMFGAQMNIHSLLHLKLCAHHKAVEVSPPQLLLNLEWLTNLEHVIHSHLNTCQFGILS